MRHYDPHIIISSAPLILKGGILSAIKIWAFEKASHPRWTTIFLVAQTRDEAVSDALLKEDKAHKEIVRNS